MDHALAPGMGRDGEGPQEAPVLRCVWEVVDELYLPSVGMVILRGRQVHVGRDQRPPYQELQSRSRIPGRFHRLISWLVPRKGVIPKPQSAAMQTQTPRSLSKLPSPCSKPLLARE